MRNAILTDGSRGDLRPDWENWVPLADRLAMRFAAAGTYDPALARVAMMSLAESADRFGTDRDDFPALAVPLMIAALRRYRRRSIRTGPDSQPLRKLQLAIAAAEDALSRRLRRSPTVQELATHLGVPQHRILDGLEAGWSAGSNPA